MNVINLFAMIHILIFLPSETKCGCTSIVIPDEGVSKEDWKPNVKDTYGIAYGLNDVEYAIETKDKFLEYQKEIEQNNINAVKKFVKLCEEYFVD